MANKFDLKSDYQSNVAGATSTFNIGTLIPTGKTRFLTYLRVSRNEIISALSIVTGVTGIVGSIAYSNGSSAYVSAGALMPFDLMAASNAATSQTFLSDKMFDMEYRGSIEHPLVSVQGGASSWMTVHTKATHPAHRIFTQYYDE